MDMNDYVQENIELLNTIDFADWIEDFNGDVAAIMAVAQREHAKDLTGRFAVKGDLFYYLTEEDVANYLAKRYGLKVESEIIEKFYLEEKDLGSDWY